MPPATHRERSLQAIAAVLKQQLDDPSQPYNGTFYRSAEDPHPPARYAQLFVHYDPNWREFVGTTLAILLEEYSDRLPEPLRKQMESAIEHAVSSEIAEARLRPDYSNIALMHGFSCGPGPASVSNAQNGFAEAGNFRKKSTVCLTSMEPSKNTTHRPLR